jgi:hypothetical protein
MERRKAIHHIATSAVALLALPAWARSWNPATLGYSPAFLTEGQQEVLHALADTLIPATDTPGALQLKVPDFVRKMLADCYEAEVQQQVAAGLDRLNNLARQTHNKDFVALEPAPRRELLLAVQGLEDPKQREYYGLLKQLTIQGYTSSEYVMVNHYGYTMAPGYYHGCVPVQP